MNLIQFFVACALVGMALLPLVVLGAVATRRWTDEALRSDPLGQVVTSGWVVCLSVLVGALALGDRALQLDRPTGALMLMAALLAAGAVVCQRQRSILTFLSLAMVVITIALARLALPLVF